MLPNNCNVKISESEPNLSNTTKSKKKKIPCKPEVNSLQ